jgi:hypothetical protein
MTLIGEDIIVRRDGAGVPCTMTIHLKGAAVEAVLI